MNLWEGSPLPDPDVDTDVLKKVILFPLGGSIPITIESPRGIISYSILKGPLDRISVDITWEEFGFGEASDLGF